MFQFAAPFWLSLPAATAILGTWALWRGQRRSRPVSSLRLWRGLEQQAKAARRRQIDPLWLQVLLAGILAGLALAGPRWVHPVPATLNVEWSVRTAPSAGAAPGATETWIRFPQASTDANLLINGTPHPLSAANLRQGLALPVTPDAFGQVRLELHANNSTAAATFKDVAGQQVFGLLEAATPDAPLDPALRRVFTVQHGARPNNPSVRPCVLLVSDPHVPPEELAQADLVIALPTAALPDLTLAGELHAPASNPAGWTPAPAANAALAWPPFVKLQDVHVSTLHQVTPTGSWQTLATVDVDGQKYPWILARQTQTADGRPALWLYLASAPATQTDWPNSPGFVLFFAEMQHRALGAQSLTADWAITPDPTIVAPPPLALQSYVGILALTLLVIAIAWFVARAL